MAPLGITAFYVCGGGGSVSLSDIALCWPKLEPEKVLVKCIDM